MKTNISKSWIILEQQINLFLIKITLYISLYNKLSYMRFTKIRHWLNNKKNEIDAIVYNNS